MAKTKILIIDSNEKYCDGLEKSFSSSNDVELCFENTLVGATKDSYIDYDIILIDCCLESNSPDTMDILETIVNSGYDKLLVANSASGCYNKELLAAGANLENTCKVSTKGFLDRLILEKLV